MSRTLPASTEGSRPIGSVWASDYGHARDLAIGLRQAVIAVYRHQAANASRAGIPDKLYDYIATGGFEARYKAMEQGAARLRAERGRQRNAMQQSWKRRTAALMSSSSTVCGGCSTTSSASAARSRLPPVPSSTKETTPNKIRGKTRRSCGGLTNPTRPARRPPGRARHTLELILG